MMSVSDSSMKSGVAASECRDEDRSVRLFAPSRYVQYTRPTPTRRNCQVQLRRRRRCVLGFSRPCSLQCEGMNLRAEQVPPVAAAGDGPLLGEIRAISSRIDRLLPSRRPYFMQLEQIARSDRSPSGRAAAGHFRRGGGINLNSMDQGLLRPPNSARQTLRRPIANDY